MVQGSILGPILWLIFFSAVSHAIKSAVPESENYVFADDLTLKVNNDDEHKRAEGAAVRWCRLNRVTMDDAKNHVIHFQNNRQLPSGVERAPETKERNLGIIFDSNLTMEKHISVVIAKGHRVITFLQRLRRYSPKDAVMAQLFRTYGYSHFEYALVAYIHATDAQLDRLDAVQRRFQGLFPNVTLPSLARRRYEAAMMFMYKHVVLELGTPCVRARLPPLDESTPRSTRAAALRHRFTLSVPTSRKDYAIKIRFDRAFYRAWNALPDNAFEKGVAHFKAALIASPDPRATAEQPAARSRAR